MEQFQVPMFQASPAPAKSPVNLSLRTCSLVSGIQQKLQCCMTSSSQQASRIREVSLRACIIYLIYAYIYGIKVFLVYESQNHLVCTMDRHLSR